MLSLQAEKDLLLSRASATGCTVSSGFGELSKIVWQNHFQQMRAIDWPRLFPTRY
jgi:hypothetical protein